MAFAPGCGNVTQQLGVWRYRNKDAAICKKGNDMKLAMVISFCILTTGCGAMVTGDYVPDEERQYTDPKPGITVSGSARIGGIGRW